MLSGFYKVENYSLGTSGHSFNSLEASTADGGPVHPGLIHGSGAGG